MFDIRDFSNMTIALLVVVLISVVQASGCAVRALTTTPKQTELTPTIAPQLDVDPNMAFVMVPTDIHVRVGDTFTVTFLVGNAADMYGWQVHVRYDSTVLECTGVSLPTSNVFSNRVTVSHALTEYDSKEFPQGPLRAIENDEGVVLAGDCLLGASQPTFYGSGVLCQIEFKAVSSGWSSLVVLHDFTKTLQTYTLNSDLTATTAQSVSYSNVYVAP
jgi:hypothetical protein